MTMSYDIHNPTTARRVIYDGSKDQKEVVIEPGTTKKAVPLADHIAKQLRTREADLQLTESKPVPFTAQTDDPQKMHPVAEAKQTLAMPAKK